MRTMRQQMQYVTTITIGAIGLLAIMLLAACIAIPPSGTIPGTTVPATAMPTAVAVPVAENQRAVLAMQLGLVEDAITIVAVEPVMWSDSCLGIASPVESCAVVETPGYRITLAANGGEYVYHTNEDGTHVRLAAAPTAQLDTVLVEWTRTDDSGCNTAQIGRDRLVFGRCMSTMLSAPLFYTERQTELAEFVGTFAPFTADTLAGTLQFHGNGMVEATPFQQRMLAEWAQLVAQEIRTGSSGPNAGMILAWHRQGGSAGFCDELILTRTGEAFPLSCKGQGTAPESFRLTAEELTTVYTWLDTFAGFHYEQYTPTETDGITVTLDFFGTGEQTVMEAEQGVVVDFAQNLFNEGRMTTAEAPAVCAQPAAGQQQLVQEVAGYCLLYPAAYSLWQQNLSTMEIISRTIMNHVDPRVSITVDAANGRTVDEVVEQLLADYAPPGFAVEAQWITVAGVEAALLDEVPGQDLTRRVVLIHNERLYTFFFAPIGDAGTTTRETAEFLYETVMGSLQLFVPKADYSLHPALQSGADVLANSALIAYAPTALDGQTIQNIELSDVPALRVDKVSVGPNGVTTNAAAPYIDHGVVLRTKR